MNELDLARRPRSCAFALLSSLLVLAAACGDDTGDSASGTGGAGGGGVTTSSQSATSSGDSTSSGEGAGGATTTSSTSTGGSSSSGVCTPSCEDRACGDDGCGDSCGRCEADQACSSEGACIDVDPGSMSFFVTSEGNLTGDFGGVAGADAFCQALADAAGAGDRTWRAYVSTTAEDARERIGAGPWFDAAGAMIAESVDDLHASGLLIENAIDENGEAVPNGNTHPGMNEHDILTGSNQDGTFSGSSCADFTSSSPDDVTTVGHCDASYQGASPIPGWNSAHASQGCDETSLFDTGSSARLYCFAE